VTSQRVLRDDSRSVATHHPPGKSFAVGPGWTECGLAARAEIAPRHRAGTLYISLLGSHHPVAMVGTATDGKYLASAGFRITLIRADLKTGLLCRCTLMAGDQTFTLGARVRSSPAVPLRLCSSPDQSSRLRTCRTEFNSPQSLHTDAIVQRTGHRVPNPGIRVRIPVASPWSRGNGFHPRF
jgi:hypothetical protein